MTTPDIRVDRVHWHGGKDTFAPVDPAKLAAEILRCARLPDETGRCKATTDLIEEVREADSDQSCGCM